MYILHYRTARNNKLIAPLRVGRLLAPTLPNFCKTYTWVRRILQNFENSFWLQGTAGLAGSPCLLARLSPVLILPVMIRVFIRRVILKELKKNVGDEMKLLSKIMLDQPKNYQVRSIFVLLEFGGSNDF